MLAAERSVKLKKKLLNVEHRTSNIDHRILYSVILKKLSEVNLPFENLLFLDHVFRLIRLF